MVTRKQGYFIWVKNCVGDTWGCGGAAGYARDTPRGVSVEAAMGIRGGAGWGCGSGTNRNF